MEIVGYAVLHPDVPEMEPFPTADAALAWVKSQNLEADRPLIVPVVDAKIVEA